jgi:hypothetical protein
MRRLQSKITMMGPWAPREGVVCKEQEQKIRRADKN